MTPRKPTTKPTAPEPASPPVPEFDELAMTIEAIEQAAATDRPLAIENPPGTTTHYRITVTDNPGQ